MPSNGYENLSVLVVDDFSSFRQTLNKMIYELGFRNIDSAASGREAYSFCQKNHYDLILCDYNLGAGKNGQQLLDDLRQEKLLKRQDIFILLSAETSRNVVMSAYDCEPDAYLTKPITNKIIEQRLKRFVHKRTELLDILTLLEQEKYEEVIAPLREKIEKSSRYSMECQKILADVYIKLERYESAEKVYRSVLEMRSLNWAQVGLAQVKLAMGDVEKSAQWLQDIINANPTYMKAYDVLSDALSELNDTEVLQQHLEKAVKISPLSLGRQISLAEAALKNGDAEVAAKAYRKSIRSSENSQYDKLENHLNYGRAIAQFFDKDIVKATEFSNEVLVTLDTIGDKFEVDKADSLCSKLLSCQLLSLKGEKNKAKKLFDEIEEKISDSDVIDVEAEIEVVNTYMAMNNFSKAHRKLASMVERYSDDQSSLEKIDPLLTEPVSEKGKKILAKINKNGISAYKKGEYVSSIDYFLKAEMRFPRYIGLKLNLAQALIGKMKQSGKDEEDVNRCISIFDIVKRYLQQDQSQSKRLVQLQEMLRSVTGA